MGTATYFMAFCENPQGAPIPANNPHAGTVNTSRKGSLLRFLEMLEIRGKSGTVVHEEGRASWATAPELPELTGPSNQRSFLVS